MSLAGHGLLFSIGFSAAKLRAAEMPGPAAVARSSISAVALMAARSLRIEEARRALVAEAREARREGRLALGRFLLRANSIDAEERGIPFDEADALARFDARVDDLRRALKTEAITRAVPEVFSDLRYRGEPGGLMGEALLAGSGSCEQIAELVAAAVFDAGKPSEIGLRFYGRPMDDGAAHVAPIATISGEERDLMSGRAAIPAGARIEADELVEVYARARGLAPPLASVPSLSPSSLSASGSPANGVDAPAPRPSSSPERPTMVSGFPPNNDRYPGSLPLYSARAVKDPVDDEALVDDEGAAKDRARDCAYAVRMASLSPMLIDVMTDERGAPSGVSLEPHRAPKASVLERKAEILRAAETLATDPRSDDADRVMGWACLAALGDSLAVDFELAGERRFADAALEKRKLGREEGAKALAALDPLGDPWARAMERLNGEFGGKSWLLLVLPGGDEAVFDLMRNRGRADDWGRVSSLAALTLWPSTQDRALSMIEEMSLRDQADVMHEIFHAHDHLRPWATNFDLEGAAREGAPGARFRRAYKVFRGLAYRLWEGQRAVGEILDGLARDVRASGLGAAWEAAFIDYCARNALGLYSQRQEGMTVVIALTEAARRCGHPSLSLLLRQLDAIEAQGALNARTLADAMRMR